MDQLFELGEIVVTPGAQEAIGDYGVVFVLSCHCHGNYGQVSQMDRRLNKWAIDNGERIVSTYSGLWEQKVVVFVVTERDRSVTTVLLGEEY